MTALLKNRQLLQFLGYFIVGGLATIVEWGCFRVFSYNLGIQYMVATTAAYCISTFSNWLFGRLLVFRNSPAINLKKEIAAIYFVSIGGLILNLLIMYLLIEFGSVREMPAKITATAIVFLYNFLLRKLWIYKTA